MQVLVSLCLATDQLDHDSELVLLGGDDPVGRWVAERIDAVMQ